MSKLVSFDAFVDAVRKGVEAFETAGGLLVEMLNSNPKVKERLNEANPWLTMEMLNMFERVGRRQLYAKLLLSEAPGFLALRRCNYSDQERFYSEPIPLLIEGSKGFETLNVECIALTRDQVAQCFSGRRLRPVSEQRAWLESKRKKLPPPRIEQPYEIRRKKLIVLSPCELDAPQLLDLARRIIES